MPRGRSGILRRPVRMVAADLDSSGQDELIADFGSAGLWARYNNATWVKLQRFYAGSRRRRLRLSRDLRRA